MDPHLGVGGEDQCAGGMVHGHRQGMEGFSNGSPRGGFLFWSPLNTNPKKSTILRRPPPKKKTFVVLSRRRFFGRQVSPQRYLGHPVGNTGLYLLTPWLLGAVFGECHKAHLFGKAQGPCCINPPTGFDLPSCPLPTQSTGSPPPR